MYYDLCLNYENPGNIQIEKYQEFCELLTSAICDGYSLFAINITKKGALSNSEINPYKNLDLKLIFQTYSLKFLNSSNLNSNFVDWESIKQLSRITIQISDSKDLYQFSNPTNALKSYDIIAATPINEKMFDLCCSDINVDIICLNLEEKFNFAIKKHLILSALDRNTFFEIIYENFINDTTKRSIFISNVLLLLEVTKGRNIIISSGASNYFEHRSPYDIITIFETIFELKTDIVKKMLSENCEKVILKSVQRKYFKTVVDLEIEEENKNKEIGGEMLIDVDYEEKKYENTDKKI